MHTFDGWDDPPPGFVEADLEAHSGPTAKGSFVQTLTLTDIATGWTECAPLLVREQKLLTEVLSEVRQQMPFSLLGFDTDTDNDNVFMNLGQSKHELRVNQGWCSCWLPDPTSQAGH